MSEPLYVVRGAGKEFAAPGETLAIIGASGSGKTTLLHLLGSLDTPSWGTVTFEGRKVSEMDGASRARLRNREIGFVFQLHHLLPEFSTVENVALPGLIGGMSRAEALKLAREALGHVGLCERAEHVVTTLSGGERQRAAIARAILMKPKVLLADEPTGSLDEQTGRKVAELLIRLNRELSMTLVVVTHNQELAKLMGRRLELHAGELYERA
jgi:lipoprotein-releasing system ATP-binding protein